MNFALADQHDRLAALLPTYRETPLSYTDVTALPEQRTSLSVPMAAPIRDLRACRLDFFFDYDLFPSSILTAVGEWRIEGRAMRAGDVILQQASVPPGPVSVKLIFAVRVLSVALTADEASFSYGTLRGHAEMGVSAFSLTLKDGHVVATIHTRSQPAQLPARIVAPVLVNPYQQYCTNRALAHMLERFARANADR